MTVESSESAVPPPAIASQWVMATTKSEPLTTGEARGYAVASISVMAALGPSSCEPGCFIF